MSSDGGNLHVPGLKSTTVTALNEVNQVNITCKLFKVVLLSWFSRHRPVGEEDGGSIINSYSASHDN